MSSYHAAALRDACRLSKIKSCKVIDKMTSLRGAAARRFGRAWATLCVILAVHVADEALTSFLDFYNPLVERLRERWSFFPLPTFEFDVWLGLLIFAVVGLLALSPLAYRGRWGLAPVAASFSVIMILNGCGHLAASAYYGMWISGTTTAPLSLAGGIYLWLAQRPAWSVGRDR